MEGGISLRYLRWNFMPAGDMRRAQTLIVWAISEGRKAARYLAGGGAAIVMP